MLLRCFALLTTYVFLLSHSYANTTKILLFGDSIIEGYGLSQNNTMSSHLERFFKEQGHNVTIINAGVSGNTTTDGKKRLKKTLENFQPDIVVLALGGNDLLRRISPTVTYSNLDAMLKILSKHDNITTILSRVEAPFQLGPQYQKNFNLIYPELADQYDVALYPFLLKGIIKNSTLMQHDRVHPNAKGMAVISEKLGDYLLDYLP